MSKQPDDLSTGEKIGAGVAGILGVFACGPCLFIPIFILLALVVGLPFSFLIGWNTAMIWVLFILAALITVFAVIGIAVNKFKEDKRKEYVKRAEFQRARETLKD